MSLQKAIVQDHSNHLRYLLKNSDRISIDGKDSAGYTPLIVCALIDDEASSLTKSKMLLRRGARVDVADGQGKTALMYACMRGKISMIKIMIKNAGHSFDINQRDNDGNTALHYAVRAGDAEAIEAIVVYGLHQQSTLNTENQDGKTALDLCLDDNCLGSASFLLECGARCGKNLESLKQMDDLAGQLITDELRDKLALSGDESPDARTCAEIDPSCFSKANKHLSGNQSLPSLRYASPSSPIRVTGSRGYHHRLDNIFKAKSTQSTKSYRPPAIDVVATDELNEETATGSKLHGRKSKGRKTSSPTNHRRRSTVVNNPSNSLGDGATNLFKRYGRKSPSSRRSSDASVVRSSTRNVADDVNDFRNLSSPMSNIAGHDGHVPFRASLEVGSAVDEGKLASTFASESDRESEIDFNEISVRVPSRKHKYSERKYGGFIETIPEIDSRSGSVVNGYMGANRSNEKFGRTSKLQRSNSKNTLNGFNSRLLNAGRNDLLTSAGSTRSAMTMMSTTGRAMSVQRKSHVKMIFGRCYEGPNRRVDIDNRIKELQEELAWMEKRRKTRTRHIPHDKKMEPGHQCETCQKDHDKHGFGRCQSTSSDSSRRSTCPTQYIPTYSSADFNQKRIRGRIPSSNIDDKVREPAESNVYTQPLPGGYSWIGLQGKITTVNPVKATARRSKSAPLSKCDIRLNINQTDDDRSCDPRSILEFIRDQEKVNRDETLWQRFYGNPLSNLVSEEDLREERRQLKAPDRDKMTLPIYGFGLPKTLCK